MKLITTRFRNNSFKPHCISYSFGKENKVMRDGVEFKEKEPGTFELPKDLKVGDEFEIGPISNNRFLGKRVCLVRKDSQRLIWGVLETFSPKVSDIDLNNQKEVNMSPVKSEEILIDRKALTEITRELIAARNYLDGNCSPRLSEWIGYLAAKLNDRTLFCQEESRAE